MTKILKTKYYPVDLDNRTIVNDPHRREVDVARKYGCKVLGMPGRRIMEHKCYESFTWISSDGNRVENWVSA